LTKRPHDLLRQRFFISEQGPQAGYLQTERIGLPEYIGLCDTHDRAELLAQAGQLSQHRSIGSQVV
jgi:hypothetical protein